MYEKFMKLLKRNGKTVYQVCKETGIPESTLYMWKRRKGNASIKTMVILAKYFNVPVDYFL